MFVSQSCRLASALCMTATPARRTVQIPCTVAAVRQRLESGLTLASYKRTRETVTRFESPPPPSALRLTSLLTCMHGAGANIDYSQGAPVGFILLVTGTWFCARTQDVVALDEWLTRFSPHPGNRIPRTGSFHYRLQARYSHRGLCGEANFCPNPST